MTNNRDLSSDDEANVMIGGDDEENDDGTHDEDDEISFASWFVDRWIHLVTTASAVW